MAEAAVADHSRSQGNFISSDPETLGFDLSSGAKWIYPENYPTRDYQFNIVQTALYNNTLVCLPTGLGKTFIAAVVMYNFWRWYPRGRIVFLAPTKPLVAQQINACHEIMGIPSEQTVELTGAVNQTKRAAAWQQKRVIFATPQTFQKDLQNDYVPYELIKCIVMDEAHKALGKHSYCEIVRMVGEKSKFFRVLALSATPGSKIDHVRQVIQNLLISELELRDDTSSDITPYTNDRSMEKIIVNLDKDLTHYRDRYINIMDPHVRILVKNNILQSNTANVSKGRIFMLMKQYESRPNKAQNHGAIMKTLNILLTMYHAYDLLLKHGLRAFHHFYSNHSDKFWLDAEIELKLMLEDIKIHIGDFPVIHPSDDEAVPDIPQDLVFGHSKFKKLQDLLVDHFKSFSLQNKSTRAIVFVEYRDIVNEVYVLLLQTRPLIRPQMFVGQAGQKQKQQLAALEDFRNNKVNVLISTSVGEEGLDVGEVDLIVCFDISTSTPTRLVQRMGRTGRKRSGRVVLLLTEGREVQTLNQAMSKKDSLNSKVLQSSNIASSLYQSSPRMVPRDITPECLAMFIKAQPKSPKARGRRVCAPRKAPAEKKAKKTKDLAAQENDDCLPSTPESTPEASVARLKCTKDKSTVGNNQPSMMKFLTDQRQPKKSTFPRDTDSGFSEEFQLPESRDNPYSFIRPHEVKLLTSDSHALEFLTLCAMSKSKKESSAASTANEASGTNLNWAPPVDLATTGHAFDGLTIPSTASLDCISNLTLCERPSPTKINDDDSFFPNKSQVSRLGSRDDESCRNDEGIADDVFTDESKYKYAPVGELHFHDGESIAVSASSSQKDLDGVELSDLFCSFAADKPANSTIRHQGDDASPAHVEVDFEKLLDECTGSEASSLPAEAANIFDDLLEGGSSSDDEDLFAVTPSNDDETAREKRRRSASPPDRTSPPKKQKLQHVVSDSSDDESTVVATPPRPPPPPVERAGGEDSEEDIFDGLDETQFSEEVRSPSLATGKRETARSASPTAAEHADDSSNERRENVRPKTSGACSGWIMAGQSQARDDKSQTRWRAKARPAEIPKPQSSSRTTTGGKDQDGFAVPSAPRAAADKENELPVWRERLESAISPRFRKYRSESDLRSSIEKARREKRQPRPKARKRIAREFIDDEARVSSDCDTTDGGSADERDHGVDDSFVSYTQDVREQVDMRAHYLRTIGNLPPRQGAFLIRRAQRLVPDAEVFSQPVSREEREESYLQDSFCVDDETHADDSSGAEDSILEQIESSLESRRRKMRRERERKRCQFRCLRRRKKDSVTREATANDDSSEDETEILRKQIMEESMMFKR